MSKKEMTVDEKFINELSPKIKNGEELSLKEIYSLFPEKNKKTISWRLYSLVQKGKLYKTGHGIYSLRDNEGENLAAGYNYLQQKSKEIYDALTEYGYNFYITGIDSLVGEILHIPENYPVLVVIEESGMREVQDALNARDMIVLSEKDRVILNESMIRNKADVFLLRGKDFSLATDNIAQKEKGFIDLYFAVTRMDYGVSVPELSRIYQSLLRNHRIAMAKFKTAARDRGITTEINWLIGVEKASKKTLEFMSEQIKEA